MKRFLGIEIGGTKLQIVCGDENGHIMRRQRFSVDQQAGSAGILEKVERTIIDWKDSGIQGIVIGFGGPVNSKTNSIGKSYQIEGWSGFDLAAQIQTISGVPVLIENDANVAALGEAIHGAGKNENIIFYVTLGSGVGGGLVANGKLYYGAVMGEAEFGHLRLDKSGRTLESSCSGWAVNKKIREAADARPNGKLAAFLNDHDGAEALILPQALQENDPDAQTILDETADDLAFGLSHVVHLFHPDMIVLGGGLSLIGDVLRDAVDKKLKGLIMDIFQPGPMISLSTLKEDAVPIGCLTLAAEKFKTVNPTDMTSYIKDYLLRQQEALNALPHDRIGEIIQIFKKALAEDRRIFVFGNGGSAANASHFVTDLGKGSSDKTYKRFKCMALNDNVSWITALGNDYSYEEIFSRQLMNFAEPHDIVLALSVSGNSPNVVNAVEWCAKNSVYSIALVGNNPCRLDGLADLVVKVRDTHFGRVEDAHMGICHIICYAFIEQASLQNG
jgi:glucokinase